MECLICMEEKSDFKNGENCFHSVCFDCYEKIQNNKCPICRNMLNGTHLACYQCGDEIDETEYVYIVDRDDGVHICSHCYNNFMEFHCNECNKQCKYFQLCVHGVSNCCHCCEC